MFVVHVVRFAVIVCTSSMSISGVLGYITSYPRNTVVIVGQSVVLNCKTNSTSGVAWQFINAANDPQPAIYSGNAVNPDYIRRNVTVESYNLRFPAIRYEDTGTFICQDDGGRGSAYAAWVSVLAAEPSCTVSNESATSNMTLSCSATVYGRVKSDSRLLPQFWWTCMDTTTPLKLNTPTSLQATGNNETYTWTVSWYPSSTMPTCNFTATITFTVLTNNTVDPGSPDFSWTYPKTQSVLSSTTSYVQTTKEGAVTSKPAVMTSNYGGGTYVNTATTNTVFNSTARIGAVDQNNGCRGVSERITYVICLLALFHNAALLLLNI